MVFSKGEGSHILDPEGNKYIDFLSAYSAVNQVMLSAVRHFYRILFERRGSEGVTV
jgi:hypothetical protein